MVKESEDWLEGKHSNVSGHSVFAGAATVLKSGQKLYTSEWTWLRPNKALFIKMGSEHASHRLFSSEVEYLQALRKILSIRTVTYHESAFDINKRSMFSIVTNT